jgi:hypothetical protein
MCHGPERVFHNAIQISKILSSPQQRFISRNSNNLNPN